MAPYTHYPQEDLETLDSIITMNEINLGRLQQRSAWSWGNRIAIGLGGILGLLSGLDKVSTVEIMNAIPPYAIELLLYALGGAAIGGLTNIIISMPNIGLVRALGDILKIAKSHRLAESNGHDID